MYVDDSKVKGKLWKEFSVQFTMNYVKSKNYFDITNSSYKDKFYHTKIKLLNLTLKL